MLAYIDHHGPRRIMLQVTPRGYSILGLRITNPEKLVSWFKKHFKELRKLCKEHEKREKRRKARRQAEKRKQAKLEAARERKRKDREEKALDAQSVGKIIISNLNEFLNKFSSNDPESRERETALREAITDVIVERDIGAHVTSVWIKEEQVYQAKVISTINAFSFVCLFVCLLTFVFIRRLTVCSSTIRLRSIAVIMRENWCMY